MFYQRSVSEMYASVYLAGSVQPPTSSCIHTNEAKTSKTPHTMVRDLFSPNKDLRHTTQKSLYELVGGGNFSETGHYLVEMATSTLHLKSSTVGRCGSFREVAVSRAARLQVQIERGGGGVTQQPFLHECN